SHQRGHVRRVLNHKSGRRWRVSVLSGKRSERFGAEKETKEGKRRYRQRKANRERTAPTRGLCGPGRKSTPSHRIIPRKVATTFRSSWLTASMLVLGNEVYAQVA